MKYVLHVIRGRSASTTLKLADGVTSIGRHDDCLIRIKSSQVSRRHCEVFEDSNKLTVRDLGSSNGTFVNGKKVAGQQVLKPGDELTLGAVTLRVAKIDQSPEAAVAPASAVPKPKPADTAVLAAIAEADSELEEFEMEFDDNDSAPEVEGIPLADQQPAKPSKPKPTHAATSAAPPPSVDDTDPTVTAEKPKEDDAVAQFLLDLKLDDEE